MGKRPVDEVSQNGGPLKSGDRPLREEPKTGEEHFEDEFEDDFESEDEIIEAGVDGRPDDERQVEEKGTWHKPNGRCE